MLKKTYLAILSIAIVSVLLASLFYNVTLAEKEREPNPVEITNLPLDEEGNLKVNLTDPISFNEVWAAISELQSKVDNLNTTLTSRIEDLEEQIASILGPEELIILTVTFQGTTATANNSIAVVVRNAGTVPVTVFQVQVNHQAISLVSWASSSTLGAGDSDTCTIYMGEHSDTYWTAGNKYAVTLISYTGQKVTYVETAW